MNEQDHWLIENWRRTRALEDAVNTVRSHYLSWFVTIHKTIKTTIDLDQYQLHMSPSEIREYGGTIIFSKSEWSKRNWLTGFYVSNISLDELTADEKPEPSICIYFNGEHLEELENMRRRISQEATNIIKDRKIIWKTKDEDDRRVLGWYEIPGGKKQLWEMLRDGKEQDFINFIAEQICHLRGFISVLDELFATKDSPSSSPTTISQPLS